MQKANKIRRLYVEKKPGYDVEAQKLHKDFVINLGIEGLLTVRLLQRYDVAGLDDEAFQQAKTTIFSEPPVDIITEEEFIIPENAHVFAVEYVPGQYDQRADSAAQCAWMLTQGEMPLVKSAKVIVLIGKINDRQLNKLKNYVINPVDSREASLEKPTSLELPLTQANPVPQISSFIELDTQQLQQWHTANGLAMSLADLQFCQQYFRDTEQRNPTITEIKVIDTYWSDHCRHTTFMTEITDVQFEEQPLNQPAKAAFADYQAARKSVYQEQQRPVCLMDMAIIGMKELRQQGLLTDLDQSEEINACSIIVPVDIDGQIEDWLVMFKNETHNHPTEIEPFGGAATCLGGCIRDPLSGRSYVYQAMRITGSADPRTPIADTLAGKLPQRKITTEAAQGYSSYGNQIGLATGYVGEVYHEGFLAKRMEIGAVIAAAPRTNVVRARPTTGDVVILVGGRTGRDGCGGATGSSREHDEQSLESCGAEVQKGNAPTERKLQRLFRNPQASQLIKRCNDFGAGGVSVAIGELTDSLSIELDAIPLKYAGLDGTELAISESQERMAVVVAAADATAFIALADQENVEATVVAEVTDNKRLQMFWRGQTIVDISRDFLDTNGVAQTTKVEVIAPQLKEASIAEVFQLINNQTSDNQQTDLSVNEKWLEQLSALNCCSQKGLVEMFDSTVGAGTVLMPFGGKHQATPSEGMAAKIPVQQGETNTGTLMTSGYNPQLSDWSPFHGALYAVVEAVAKIVAMGGDYQCVRLTLQEYFQKLGDDPQVWGKPFAALLGAYKAQRELAIPAIGGKDSMSGTFRDIHVPPTLVAFAVTAVDVREVVSPEFKQTDSKVILVQSKRDEQGVINFTSLKKQYSSLRELVKRKQILAMHTVRAGGIAEAVSKMSFGNKIGLALITDIDYFSADFGSIVVELNSSLTNDTAATELLETLDYIELGKTTKYPYIIQSELGLELAIAEIEAAWQKTLENIFPTQANMPAATPAIPRELQFNKLVNSNPAEKRTSKITTVPKPRVVIPVFPGTNCEYETERAFIQAGAIVDTFIVRNLTDTAIEESIAKLDKLIKQAQIVMLPGGFSGGDEPDGSGKFFATLFRNARIMNAIQELLEQRDGLMLGICNGFQALIKLGLLPYGEVSNLTESAPTLTHNLIGRHISCMAQTRIVNNSSPWLQNVTVGDIHNIAFSHGEGRFVAPEQELQRLLHAGQIASCYVDDEGQPSYDIRYNPNGSLYAIEGITSPDGRIFGKMGHSERIANNVGKNVSGQKDQQLFTAGVSYFK